MTSGATPEQVEAWTKITTLILGKAMVDLGRSLIASVEDEDLDPGLGAVKEKGCPPIAHWVCNQKGCEEEATFLYRWPSDPGVKYVCRSHGERVRAVSEAMGFVIVLEAIGGD